MLSTCLSLDARVGQRMHRQVKAAACIDEAHPWAWPNMESEIPVRCVHDRGFVGPGGEAGRRHSGPGSGSGVAASRWASEGHSGDVGKAGWRYGRPDPAVAQ